ncbi:metalloregulator ArsR/SmtB family transcription factor [Alphaproteobacteria bacterium]|jgi:DNA-binding transcriptional ArsR family regulator|nr:metalloregulator ArsR/SmtB family transcription factor [Alphaproteobacteria bacterium]
MTYEMILTALADPTRRAIFEDLSTSPSAVSVLAEGRPVSRPAVSQHLKVLEQAGLIKARKRGTARIYHVTPQGLGPLRDYLDEMWGDALSAFAAETIKQSDKQTENEDA